MHNASNSSDLQPCASVGVVLLAAGSATRLGHRPKCLLELSGEPLIQRQLQAIMHLSIAQTVVVLGHYAAQIEPILKNFPVTRARNPTPDAGQNSSLHCGLNALSQRVDAVLVMLADQPLLDARDIDDLIRAFHERPQMTDVAVPTVNALPGNPVIFSAAVRDAILAGDNTFGCKQWQLDNPERVYRWQTTNQHYRIDIDTPDDMQIFTARTGLNLCWPIPHDSI